MIISTIIIIIMYVSHLFVTNINNCFNSYYYYYCQKEEIKQLLVNE